MAIEKIYLDPNAQTYSDDQIVGKVNTATANITRAGAVDATARPIAAGEVGAAELSGEEFTAGEQSKLTGIDAGAEVNPSGTEMKDAIVALADLDRELVISRPVAGQKKIVAVQTHSDGTMEVEQNDTAEV